MAEQPAARAGGGPGGALRPVTIVADQLRRRATSGIATYTRGLLLGLRALGSEAPPVTLAASRPDRGTDPLTAWGWPVRSSPVPGPVLTRLWDRGLAQGAFGTAGVLHATSLATPYPAARPVAVTVHDLAWREVPEAFPPRGRRWHEQAFRRCVDRATAIVVPSERTGSLVVDAGVPADRVVTIAEGCDHLPPADGEGARTVLRRLGVDGPYLLSVSTLEPRKNLRRLVAAYDLARARLPEPWPLIVVGPSGWGEQVQPSPGVVFAGRVDDAVLAALYAGARCLAYVPLVEGFGLPAVEAMAACVPVVASPMPSTGGAALEVDPLDVEAIADGLTVAAGDERRRAEIVTAGLLRAGDLTWEAAARAHVTLWESLP